LKKWLVTSIVLIFLGLVFGIGGTFGVFYISIRFYLSVLFGMLILAWGITEAIFSRRKWLRLSGSDLAKETILEQIHHLSQIIGRKETKRIKHENKAKKLSEEVECLYKASNNLKETIK